MQITLLYGILTAVVLGVIVVILLAWGYSFEQAYIRLAWLAPAAFGALFLFKRSLESALGYLVIVPLVVIPLISLVLAAIGIGLLISKRDRRAPVRALLAATTVASLPAVVFVAMLLVR